MVFTTKGFFEAAIESWPEWELDRRPLNRLRRSNRLSYQAMSSRTHTHTHTRLQVTPATKLFFVIK